jgi:methylenetetrahydrofolate dehydrogenase (NADP+)/methenyltetrahydrofolate cyclohydrolase
MYKTLSGREVSKKILEEVKAESLKMEKKPSLAIVLVGEDPASEVYVKMKLKKASKYGVDAELYKLDESTKEEDLLKLVSKLNNDSNVDGFIVQSPLPKHIDEEKVIQSIDPKKDVDGWTRANMGELFLDPRNDQIFLPATPAGVIEILDHYGVELKGKNAVVVGRSNVVGKPLAMLLLGRNATVTICHSKTENLKEHTKNADVVVAAAGVPGMIRGDMVKEGAYVVDVGTTRVDGKIIGDVNFEEVIKKANCSPVPGGAGPMTVAMLIRNTLKAAKGRIK